MATLPTGQISLSEIADYFGDTDQDGEFSLSEFYGMTYQIPASGQVSMDDFRGVAGHYGNRGLFSRDGDFAYVTISTTGNATSFGTYTAFGSSYYGTAQMCSNATRGVHSDGSVSTQAAANFDYITFATTGNAAAFDDPSLSGTGFLANVSNGVRGLFSGQTARPSSSFTFGDESLLALTIATTGSCALTGGSLTSLGNNQYGATNGGSNGTRGVFIGRRYKTGYTETKYNNIDYITITSNGNSADFGDLLSDNSTRFEHAVGPHSTRAIIAGGYNGTAGTDYRIPTNRIDYITISTTGNSTNFGNLTVARGSLGGSGNGERVCFAGGYNGDTAVGYNVIDYKSAISSANAVDFGDMTSTSNSDGGPSGSGSGA